MSEEPSKSFWTSATGLLTGGATFITAVVGLLTILHQIGCFGQQKKVDPPPPEPREQSVAFTHGCVINGESVVVTSSNLVLSKEQNLLQVGARVPPHPDCRFCLDSTQGPHYCVTPDGQVYDGSILVGTCWSCNAGGC